MWDKTLMNRRFLSLATTVSIALAAVMIAYSLYLIFMVVPNERTMGPVQRIFYFHVGAAIASYLSIAIVFFSSLGYLATGQKVYDAWNVSAAELGFLLTSIVLISGMIWGYSAWNTPFRLEPRLVSFLLLWLIFLSFVLLRVFGDELKIASHSAILGILGAVMVPIMIYSVKLLPQAAQLHPQVLENRGLQDPSMQLALSITILSVCILQFALLFLRIRLELFSQEIGEREY